jgi:uncharacterized protein (TIGR02147 family)
MKSNEFIQNRLRQALVEAKSRNPQISIRAFAKRIGLPAGTVSLFLLGKRNLSRVTALKFADALHFDPIERQQLCDAFKVKKTGGRRAQKSLQPEALRLSADRFHVLKDWYYFALLNLICIPGENHGSFALSARLGLPELLVKEAIERLKRLNLIRREGDWLIRCYRNLKLDDDAQQLTLLYSHHQNLELARQALTEIKADQRDFSSLTVPLDSSRLSEIKAKVRDFYQNLIEEYAVNPSTPVDEVFQIQVQTFPLTKNKSGVLK